MQKILLSLMLTSSFTFISACRTTKSNDSETWSSQENRTATIDFIKKSITELLPDVSADDPALNQFAESLQNNDTKQTESAQFLLSQYAEQRRAGKAEDTDTQVVNYILEQFLAMTNYIAIHKKEDTTLKYIGYEGQLPKSASN